MSVLVFGDCPKAFDSSHVVTVATIKRFRTIAKQCRFSNLLFSVMVPDIVVIRDEDDTPLMLTIFIKMTFKGSYISPVVSLQQSNWCMILLSLF